MSLFRHWKTILLVMLVFVAGAACGAVGTVRAIQREYRNKLDATTWTPRTLEWLRKAASLTVAQEEEIRPIVDDAIMQMKELRDDGETRRKSIVKELLLAVAIKLPEPQQEQLSVRSWKRWRSRRLGEAPACRVLKPADRVASSFSHHHL